MNPRLTSVGIDVDDVIIRGIVETPLAAQPPEATFTVRDVAAIDLATNSHVCDARSAWSPGSTIAGYRWEFSDGTVEISSDVDARFITKHDLFVGPRGASACLTVTNTEGRSTDVCRGIGRVYVHVDVRPPWERPPLDFSGGIPWVPRPPIRSELLAAAVVPNGTPDPATLPLIAADDPETALASGLPPSEIIRSLQGFRFDPIEMLQREVTTPPAAAPSLPDLDLLYPEFPDRTYLAFGVTRGPRPAMDVDLAVRAPDGRELATGRSNKEGRLGLEVDLRDLRAQHAERPGMFAGLGRTHLDVEVPGKERIARSLTLWLVVRGERAELLADWRTRLLDSHRSLLKAVGGRDVLRSGAWRQQSALARSLMCRAAYTMERLRNAFILVAHGSAMSPLRLLLGLAHSERDPRSIVGRVNRLFDFAGTDVREIRDMHARKHGRPRQ